MTSSDPHVTHSQLRESLTTHAFLAIIGSEIWRRGHYDTEIMKPEFDASGHDLVITANGVTRHIQLKATILSSRRANWDASDRLASRPSGCLIVLHVDDENLKIQRFGLFAGPPGTLCPTIPATEQPDSGKGTPRLRKSHERTDGQCRRANSTSMRKWLDCTTRCLVRSNWIPSDCA